MLFTYETLTFGEGTPGSMWNLCGQIAREKIGGTNGLGEGKLAVSSFFQFISGLFFLALTTNPWLETA